MFDGDSKANAGKPGGKALKRPVIELGFTPVWIALVNDVVACPAVLALELAPGDTPSRLMLTREEAQELAGLVAEDLRNLLPGVETSRLAVAGALFDAVELLRPGFPVHATLDELARRIPRVTGEAAVVAFGSNQGQMPAQPLVPDPAYAGGPMRLVPWTLLADEALAEDLAARIETELVGRGEAGARTSDFLMRTLGVRFEHARYLSRNDVMAMTCVQYEHVNLAPLWTLLEAALLTPYKEESTLTLRGLPLHYGAGRVSAPPLATWFAETADNGTDDAGHQLAGILFELRQYSAVLNAHGIAFGFEGTAPTVGYAMEVVNDPNPTFGKPRLFAHQARGLGVVAVTVAQTQGSAEPRILAHGFPLAGDAMETMLQALHARYDADETITDLGTLFFAPGRRLAVPAASVH